MKEYCGRCHTCGTPLKRVLDGEEWCAECRVYRRYWSHGWAWIKGYDGYHECPILENEEES